MCSILSVGVLSAPPVRPISFFVDKSCPFYCSVSCFPSNKSVIWKRCPKSKFHICDLIRCHPQIESGRILATLFSLYRPSLRTTLILFVFVGPNNYGRKLFRKWNGYKNSFSKLHKIGPSRLGINSFLQQYIRIKQLSSAFQMELRPTPFRKCRLSYLHHIHTWNLF